MSTTPTPLAAPVRTRAPRDVDCAAEIERLRAQLDAQARLIRQQAAHLAHGRKIFKRASAAAKIGVWECSLPEETLTWTDQIYEIFELPRGSIPDRGQILRLYSGESLKALQDFRSRAIAERGGFNLDAEITTAKGRRRWIRITASVECEDGVPVRIFGMKQDITEEKILYERTRYLAHFDVLTGLANRSSFQAKLSDLEERRGDAIPFSALLLVDLDGFKQINDTFGHAHGDECLKSAADRLKSVCRERDFVARLGGDEFAVLLSAHVGDDEIEAIAEQIVGALREPVDGRDCSFKIGASVGVARVDTFNPVELFEKADAALYAAKAAGRDTFRMFGSIVLDLDGARPTADRNAGRGERIGRRAKRARRSAGGALGVDLTP